MSGELAGAAAMAEMQIGIYLAGEEAIGALSPKFQGERAKYGFMVTNVSSIGAMKIWSADLMPGGAAPDDDELAGSTVWNLLGHPEGHVFICNGDTLVQCDKDWGRQYTWQLSPELHSRIFQEPAAPPQKQFPSEHFHTAVICKNPELNQPYSPSTQTIVDACTYFKTPLPEDVVERQKQLVRLYTAETPLYHEMNQALREDSLDKMKYFGAYIKELRDVFKTDHIDQIIEPFEGTVWRGINFPDKANAIQEYQPGSIFVWPAFTSMTTNQNVGMHWGSVAFQITCTPPPGTYNDDMPEYAPASVKEFSCYPSEDEILFPPNIKFKVIEVQEPSDDNDLTVPLVVCETVGLDTDQGIAEFVFEEEPRTISELWKAMQKQRVIIDEQAKAIKRLSDITSEYSEEVGSVQQEQERQAEARESLEKAIAELSERFDADAQRRADALDALKKVDALEVETLEEAQVECFKGQLSTKEDVAGLCEKVESLEVLHNDLAPLRGLQEKVGVLLGLRAEIEPLLGLDAKLSPLQETCRTVEEKHANALACLENLKSEVVALGNSLAGQETLKQEVSKLSARLAESQDTMRQRMSKCSRDLVDTLTGQEGIKREMNALATQLNERTEELDVKLRVDRQRAEELGMVLKSLSDSTTRARSRTLSAERRQRQPIRSVTAEAPDGSVQVQLQVSGGPEAQGNLPSARSLTSLGDSAVVGGAWQLARARRQASDDGSKDLASRQHSLNPAHHQVPPREQTLTPLEPKPREVTFEDPRKKKQSVGVIGFYFHGKAEEWDSLCGSAFLGNFWELGVDGIQLEASSPFKLAPETKAFTNAEAAFQVLQFWGEADRFRYLSGEEAIQLRKHFHGCEDGSYGGYGNVWLGMLAILRAKFTQNTACLNALLRTDDAYLVAHSGVTGRDPVWSDNCVGDGMNWLGLQLMLIRDEMWVRKGGPSTWTQYIQNYCGIDLKTGEVSGRKGAWQTTVNAATHALVKRLASKA